MGDDRQRSIILTPDDDPLGTSIELVNELLGPGPGYPFCRRIGTRLMRELSTFSTIDRSPPWIPRFVMSASSIAGQETETIHTVVEGNVDNRITKFNGARNEGGGVE